MLEGWAPATFEAGSGFDPDGTPWAVAVSGDGLLVSVGNEDVLLTGCGREKFTEAVARTAMPGQTAACGTENP